MTTTARWWDVLEDFYGVRLDDDKARRWADNIRQSISNVNEAEIITALRWSAESFSRNAKKARPDLVDVIMMVRNFRQGRDTDTTVVNNTVRYRSPAYDKDGNYNTDTTEHVTTLAELRYLLNRRPDPVEAWNIICTPSDPSQCAALLAHCDENKIPYERFRPNLDRQIRQVVSKVARS